MADDESDNETVEVTAVQDKTTKNTTRYEIQGGPEGFSGNLYRQDWVEGEAPDSFELTISESED